MTDDGSPNGQGKPRSGLKRADVQFILIGVIAVSLPLCFIVIIFIINFGGGR